MNSTRIIFLRKKRKGKLLLLFEYLKDGQAAKKKSVKILSAVEEGIWVWKHLYYNCTQAAYFFLSLNVLPVEIGKNLPVSEDRFIKLSNIFLKS